MNAVAAPGGRIQKAGLRQQVLSVAHVRLLAVLGLFVAAMALIMGKLLWLSIAASGNNAADPAAGLVPKRGDIVDRNGIPLARTFQVRALRYDPAKLLGDRKFLAEELARIFPETPEAEFRRLLASKKPVYIRRRILPELANQVRDLGEVAFDFPIEDKRIYPHASTASHVLGYLDAGGEPRMGMEKVLEKPLTDAARRGQPVALSIDVRVQAALESELGQTMLSQGAIGAAGLVLDVRTGEVLAMASLPSYNPNAPTPNAMDASGELTVRNKVTNQPYELGSTFKPLSVAAAIDAGTVRSMSRRYDATKPLMVGGFPIRDLHSTKRWLNVPETLVHSSNIVTARIADELGKARMEAMVRNLAFDKRPFIELEERAKPIWPTSWGRTTTMTVAYGHGISITPLHLASGYAAMVNGGIWRPATLMKVERGREVKGRRVFKPATSARMRQLLRMIVVDGTGGLADAPGFRVGGKTGTADKPHKGGGYRINAVVSTFAGVFPMDDPRYVVIAMLDEPTANAASGFQRTAGLTAAPIVGRLVPRIGPMLGVYPDENRDIDVSELTPLLWKSRKD